MNNSSLGSVWEMPRHVRETSHFNIHFFFSFLQTKPAIQSTLVLHKTSNNEITIWKLRSHLLTTSTEMFRIFGTSYASGKIIFFQWNGLRSLEADLISPTGSRGYMALKSQHVHSPVGNNGINNINLATQSLGQTNE